ncbi:MAG: type II and III secretion system protein, partial [Acidobacteria bacterium]|nr:type II and III secretion system protein [Acidobacteriota bacterium]
LEIPVPTVTDLGNVGTEYRQTGVSLEFTPTVLDEGQISLTVAPRIREVAAGGATIAGAVVPNINERSASTTVELGDGESIAIAGLYRRTRTSTEAGVPLLKDIPVWGALFRNATERDRSVELIIVVTPRIVAALPAARPAPGAPAPGATARQLANEFYL